MTTDDIIKQLIGDKDEEKTLQFLSFLSEKLWSLFYDYQMRIYTIAESEIKAWNPSLPNAKENIVYEQTVYAPRLAATQLADAKVKIVRVEGIDEEAIGLDITLDESSESFTLAGTPTLETLRERTGLAGTLETTFTLTIELQLTGISTPESPTSFTYKLPFVINQDPRKLWKKLPVNWEQMPEPRYQKDDVEAEYVKVEALADGTPQKDIVAASKRGRSHAQEAKPRDDHFQLKHLDNGWYIITVADGAGSATFSREGSRIACQTVVDFCTEKLQDNQKFEEDICLYDQFKNESESEARKIVGDHIYHIVGNAALSAHNAIKQEAQAQGKPEKLYATTLLVTICRKFEFGWFVASFWVGDGAICLYDREAHTAKILGIPDEGEYAGQTRFLTMADIFKDSAEIYRRLRFQIVPDFTALILMSDGVSDPKFETDANLQNSDKWDALWDDLKANGVDLSDDNEAAREQLTDWLDFWSPGNHDDRTIAILY